MENFYAHLTIYVLTSIFLLSVSLFFYQKSLKYKSLLHSESEKKNFLEREVVLQKSKNDSLESKINDYCANLATLTEREKNAIQRLEEKENEIHTVRAKMHADFELLANKIFDEAKKKITGENKEQISQVLNPLKEDLKNFSKRVEDINASGEGKHAKLEEQIKMLKEMNVSLNKEASNLAKALKNDNKAAGTWGEMILEKILNSCGFEEGREYKTQVFSKNEEGERFFPDVVLFLPQNKHIIIDSKVSLLDYVRYCEAQDEEASHKSLQAFTKSMKSHIDGLSEKKYEELSEFKNPEFVLLFLPIEAAFNLLTTANPEIYKYAFERKIVLVTASTLLATLKTIEYIWRMENQANNSKKIADLGASLYEKIRVFTDKFLGLKKSIDSLSRDYDDSMKSLAEGKGNLISSAEKMRILGVKAKSKIDEKLLEKSNEEQK